MSVSPYDDGWLLDLLAIEIRLNDPRAVSARETTEQPPSVAYKPPGEEPPSVDLR
jgi:hypothetical protein